MKKWLKLTLGIVGLVIVIIAMTSASNWQANLEMEAPDIIVRMDGDPLISKEEVQDFLRIHQYYLPGMKFENIDYYKIEEELKKKPEILDAKVYTEIGNKWAIDIQQRKPIVRVFNQKGESFYIDELGKCIVSKAYHSSRVLIANGYIYDSPSDIPIDSIINNDSLKTIKSIDNIYRISNYVCNDSFLMSQISQIYLRKDGDFILVPQIGDQIIVLGKADSDEEVKEKFNKLITFYKEGIPYEGWSKYKEINLKFRDQIVCKRR